MGNGHFDEKFRAVGLAGGHRIALADPPRDRPGIAEVGDLLAMGRMKTLGQQFAQGAAEDIGDGVAKHLFGRRIEPDDAAPLVDRHERIHCRHADVIAL